jgi:hypothetical protein
VDGRDAAPGALGELVRRLAKIGGWPGEQLGDLLPQLQIFGFDPINTNE